MIPKTKIRIIAIQMHLLVSTPADECATCNELSKNTYRDEHGYYAIVSDDIDREHLQQIIDTTS